MILPPLKRKDDGTNDLNFAIPINNILTAMASFLENSTVPPNEPPIMSAMDFYIAKAMQSVVLLRIGSTWATGVIVSNAGRKQYVSLMLSQLDIHLPDQHK